jgi:DNA polymerase-4
VTSSPARRILLVDADAFFVAVARMIDPEGAGKAKLLIVGGSRESRGVVCSASYETRKFGVRSAMPMSRALRLCPDAMCVPVPHRECGVKSREIGAVLDRFAPVVEPASIDEWYLDLAGTEQLFHDEPLAETASRIREAVVAETGLTVSIGGGTSKLVAKLAVERAKPSHGASGVHIVPPGEESDFLRGFMLAEIPQIGPKFQERLAKLGMRTVPDVLQYDLATLRGWFGVREADWLHDRVLGRDDSAVEPRSEAKSISRDETFATDIHDDGQLEEELLRLVVRAASDLRSDAMRTRTITVRIRDHDFKSRQASRTLPETVEADRVIFNVARELLKKLRRARRVPARRLTVALSSLSTDAGAEQLAFLSDARAQLETERDRTLARTVDKLRDRFGDEAIVLARLRRG